MKSIMSLLVLSFPSGVKVVTPSSTISGEIDIASVPVLRERLIGLPRPQASRIIIDLSGVTFCDASGLAVLVGASRRAGLLGGVLRLAAPAPMMATVLRLTGLHSRFEIFATVSEAIGAVAHRVAAKRTCRSQVPAGQLSTRRSASSRSTAAAGGRGGVR